jgi:hypothetical protein
MGLTFDRIPLNEIKSARVVPVRPYVLWFFAVILFVVGAITTYLMFAEPVLVEGRPDQMKVWGIPMAVAVAGLALPFAGRGRYALEVKTVKRRYRWKPPLVFGQTARANVRKTIWTIVDGLARGGVEVVLPPGYWPPGASDERAR